MDFSKPRQYKAKLSQKHYLSESEKYMYLHFELISPTRLEFRAGQYLNVKVSEEGKRRAFSFVSTPDNTHSASIVAEILPDGVASKMFATMKEGEEVDILAPLGRFVIDEDEPGEKLLFVATGSGIAPLYSMINDLLVNKKDKRPMRLHWGLRYEEDIFWLDNLERLAEEYDNFVFDLVLSKPKEGWELCWGHVQDCIKRDIGDLSKWEAYVSGNQNMISSVSELLFEKGLLQGQLYKEKFY